MTDREHSWKPVGGISGIWEDFNLAEPPPTTTALTGTRNGMPEPGGYVHGAKDAAREAEFAARMAALRARFPGNYSTEEGE
jgi:hypothetical protein